MKKFLPKVLLAILFLILLCILIFLCIYFTRLRTISTITKMSSYEDGYNLYRMDIKYDYDLDAMIAYDINDNQGMFDAIIKESLPLLPIKMQAPSFGCSAFSLTDTDGNIHMGRNYDFRYDTSVMLVYCAPNDGYRSVAFAALDNVSANAPDASIVQKLASLTAPYICLDGMNEKGVSIAVLTVDSTPVHQDTGKPTIFTTLAIRLVLDRAATTEEAVELLRSYDMFASSGKDYHFYINDASGDGRVLEYDCDSKSRELIATPINAVTNFYAIYEDRVLPNQKNGSYGHGKERYDAILKVFDEQKDSPGVSTAWDALKAAAQDPKSEELTSNTQWSIVYHNTDCTAEIVLRRHWNDIYQYNLNDNELVSP